MEENKENPQEQGKTETNPTPSVKTESTIAPPSAEELFIQRFQKDISTINESVGKVKAELKKVIQGQEKTMDLLLISLFTQGHVLLEGVPGIAKTLIAKLLAQTLSCNFSRIQFTPDLMPTDVTGTSIFNMSSSEFVFKKGPIFSSIILIDEINRSPAKTQASLMEVMEEKQISYDGVTYPMEKPFMVIATQNPVEQEGTYKLPEAQLDRFLFRIKLSYPNLEDEKEILKRFKNDFQTKKAEEVKAVFTQSEIKKCGEIIEKIEIKDQLLDYIVQIVCNTRNNPDLFLGASPRASLAIMKASKALAAMRGRGFVIPDDIQYVCYPVLNHRIILSHEREMEGAEAEDIIGEIIKKIEVPR